LIKRLPEDVFSKIAAGEVIHRPFSVVKELVENSIDAKAGEINIEIKDGGKKLISINDNGTGMSKEDLMICAEKHSTSKLFTVDDLDRVNTLGFRGEALNSIASVSRMEISSKIEEAPYGLKIKLDGSKVKKHSSIPMNTGTKIEVKNLFYNLPVRQKFMKSSASEARLISEVIIRFMLSNPDIRFSFISNNREIFLSPGSGDLLQTIGIIFGDEFSKNMVRLDEKISSLKIKGYISNLELTKRNSKYQYLFLNGRYIKNNMISYAISEAYRAYHREKKFPVFVLELQMDPSLYDVNIHPTKEEVRFAIERELFSIVRNSVVKCLRESLDPYTMPEEEKADIKTKDNMINDSKKIQEDLFKKNDRKTAYKMSDSKKSAGSIKNPQVIRPLKQDKVKVNKSRKFSEFKVLGQVQDTYIIIESPKGISIIDQHVAHERVLYEKYMKRVNSEKVKTQRLLFPINIELKPYESGIIEGKIDDFQRIGVIIEKFGESMFVVREVPVFISTMEEQMVRELIDELFTSSYIKNIGELKEEMLINSSCKNAIKAGKPLSFPEMEMLISELFLTEFPYTCPHGRPVILEYSFNEINKKFQRTLRQ